MKYSNEQIKQVCELLMDTSLTFSDIAEKTGTTWAVVGSVYRKEGRLKVSKPYTFPKRTTMPLKQYDRNVKYSKEQVERICALLDDKYGDSLHITYRAIADAVDVPESTVSDISNGLSWVSISKNHPFYQKKFGDKVKSRV